MTSALRGAIVRRVVRGESDVDCLAEIGVQLETDPVFALVEPAIVEPFSPSLADVATGVIAFWARGGREARVWAKVMLGASNVIDITTLEDSSEGSLLLDLLWRFSADEAVDDGAIDVLRKFAG